MSTIKRRPTTRRSLIWATPPEQFKEIVAQSRTLSEMLRRIGIRPIGNNNLTLKKRLKEEGVDYSHIVRGRRAGFGDKAYRPSSKTLEECMSTVFVAGKEGGKNSVRRYLRRYNLIGEKCRDCGLTDQWNGKPLRLQLEHISGDSTDDRLENLCWLCPNCHSQTPTYTGKANRNPRPRKIFGLSDLTVQPKQQSCRRGQGQRKGPRPECHKVLHPSKEELQVRVWEKPIQILATDYGVRSSNTIKEWCETMGVTIPPRGYWQRRAAGWTHDEALKPWPKGLANGPIFTADQVREIRRRIAADETIASIRRDLGCGHKTLRDLRDGLTYRWVETPIS